jgi:hypothetical protein
MTSSRVGISTSGSGDTGSLKKAMVPAAINPNVSSVVATGRRMNGLDKLMSETNRPFVTALCAAHNNPMVRSRVPKLSEFFD